jgi:DNA-binding response OmpR family regulator
MRVLLVDDEEEFVSTLVERLNIRGIDADWASSGEEGLRRAREVQYDIAVLDMKMPRISGLDLKAKIQEISPDTKFVFLTGHGSEEDFMAAKSVSEYYLIKPIQIDDLIEKLKQIIVT